MSWIDRKYIWIGLSAAVILTFTLPLLFQWISDPVDDTPDDDETTTIPPPEGKDFNNTLLTMPPDSNTTPSLLGQISIDSIGSFTFDPKNVTSIRSDLFNLGFFSLFDILVYLDTMSKIDLVYSFNASLDTHTIHTINSVSNWWYRAHYSGGWWEWNYFRMDYYPYKDKTAIQMYLEPPAFFETVYGVFREEVQRRISNNGSLVVPTVTLRGPPPNTESLVFTNVTVFAHNVRRDVFKLGVITAIDTILSLDDQGEISAGLTWYESVGTAQVVKTYYVEKINDWIAYDTCGFVYETGDTDQDEWKGNHIHIPSDTRIMYFPEYVFYFWICL